MSKTAQQDTIAYSPSTPIQALPNEKTTIAGHRIDPDAALQLITEVGETVNLDPAKMKKLRKKIDRHIMPLMIALYFLQYSDKALLSQSSVFGIKTDLNLLGQEYSWVGSIFYFGYLAVQFVAAYLLQHFPLGVYAKIATLIWGGLVICTAATQNFAGLMVIRFFLGFVEGGISPCFVLMTAQWYTREEQPLRTSLWFAGNGIAPIIQGVTSYGMAHIQSSIEAWRWFFIIWGLLTMLYGVFLFFYMPDSPLHAKFLSKEETVLAVERIRANRTGITNRHFKIYQLKEALLDPKSYFFFFLGFLNCIPAGGVQNFGNLILASFGFTAFDTTLLSMPGGAWQVICLVGFGWYASTVPNRRCLCAIASLVPALIGAFLMYFLPTANQGGRLAGFYLSYSSTSALILIWASAAANIAGQTKKQVVGVFLFLGYSVGQIAAPLFFIAAEAPGYPTGFRTMIVTYILTIVLTGFYWAYLWCENRRNVKRRAAAELNGDTYGVENEEFLDLTDKEQIRFVYTY